MSIVVHPDPQEPAGGYAFLELPEGSLVDQTATVSVFDAYGERWLAPSEGQGERIAIGDANWQSEQMEFGPYPVHRHEGADWVRIGPEIVNKLDEYAPLRISVAGKSFDLTWPDTVPPRAGAAVLGGLQTVARQQTALAADNLVGKQPAEAPAEPAPEPEPIASEVPVDQDLQTRRGSLLWLILLLIALLASAAAAWYFWPDEMPKDVPDSTAEPVADRCSLAALGAITGGFENTAKAIRDCGTQVSADNALQLVEEAAAKDDAAALLVFGTLYDGSELDPRIENLIGLSFDDDAAQAAEYYARAVNAGSADAVSRLTAVCTRLSASNATLAKGAHDDFCS